MQNTPPEISPRFQTAAQAAVYSGCIELAIPTGIVSNIDGSFYRIVALRTSLEGIQPGMIFHLGETICAEVARSGQSVIQPDVSENHFLYKHPVYVAQALRCYIGSPIVHSGDVVGTLNFSSEEPRDAFDQEQVELVDSLANQLAECLDSPA